MFIMLSCCMRNVIRNNLNRFKVKSFKNRIKESYFHSIKGTGVASFYCQNVAVKRTELSFPPVKRSLCMISPEIQNDGKDSFYSLLKEIEGETEVTKDIVMSYLLRMDVLLDSEKLVLDQERDITESVQFVRLFTVILKNLNSFSANDLIIILGICKKLALAFDSRLCVFLLSKVAINLHDLDFSGHVKFLTFLEYELHPKVASNLKAHLHKVITENINDKSFLESSEDIAAGINYGCIKTVPSEVTESVLQDVLDLEVWDHPVIYQKVLTLFSVLSKDKRQKYKNMIFSKVNEEILKCTKVQFICMFLSTLGSQIQADFVECDVKLIENVVNRAMELKMENYDMARMTTQLARFSFVHHKFLSQVVSRVKKTSDPILQEPKFVRDFLYLLAHSNCDEDTVVRWNNDVADLKDLLALKTLLNHSRRQPVRYIYNVLTLASLGIFIDEELIYISKYFDNSNVLNCDKKTLNFLLLLNQAVKVFHPTFSNPLLSDSFTRFALIGLLDDNPPLWKFIYKISKILNSRTKVENCVLFSVITKLGMLPGGIVGVNNDGQLFDFKDFVKEKNQNKNKMVYLEDVILPEEFKLMAVVPIKKAECSANALDVNPPRSLQIQILKALKYPTVLVYEKNWEDLNDTEKGEHLYRKICEKYRLGC